MNLRFPLPLLFNSPILTIVFFAASRHMEFPVRQRRQVKRLVLRCRKELLRKHRGLALVEVEEAGGESVRITL